jgi:two-component system, chemotaxis family, protein-glutamate methylesterase/glutaminase
MQDVIYTEPAEESLPPPFGIVAFGSSAGGLATLIAVLSGLPGTLPLPIVVVQHVDRRHRSLLAEILDRRCLLEVKEAEAGECVQAGIVYTAPADRHLLISDGGLVELTKTELVHFVRPSVDLLFESVAASFKERAIAVVLSGTGVDGAIGAEAVKRMNGTVIAQDQETSAFFGMPGAAIKTGCVDFILPLPEIASALVTPITGERK